jgi:ribonucleotide monophosphatase NagD (HAD superfamily)
VQALAGAVEAVKALHERGVRMVINSNSPQNEETTLERLERLGFQRQWFVGAVTSGTMAAPLLASGTFGASPRIDCSVRALGSGLG